MKIGLFANLPPGGAENVIKGLINEINSESKFKLDFYSHYDESKFPETNNFKYHKLSWLQNINTKKYLKYILENKYIKLNKKFSQKINKKNYDFFILGPDWITQTSPLALFLNVPVVQIGTELKREYYEQTEWGLYRKIKQTLWKKIVGKVKKWEIESLNNSEKIVVHSIYSKSIYQKVLNNISKIEVIYPFLKSIYLENSELEKLPKSNFILSVGRLSWVKGYDFIIKALAKLPPKKRPILKVVGQTGPHTKRITQLAKQKSVNISIETNISDNKLYYFYNKAKLFVYFPRSEPFGLSIIESLTQRCKTLAINNGGFTEYAIKSKNCSLIPRSINTFKNVYQCIINKPIHEDKSFIEKVRNDLNPKTYSQELIKVGKSLILK